MGNCCFVVQEKKVIKIVMMDGKILRYHAPLRVHQVLAKFPKHAISGAHPLVQQLDPMTKLRCGQLYYLVPPQKQTAETVAGDGVVRIKLVLSKQELKDILSKGGVSLDDIKSFLQRDQPRASSPTDRERCMLWESSLDTIPEGNDSH